MPKGQLAITFAFLLCVTACKKDQAGYQGTTPRALQNPVEVPQASKLDEAKETQLKGDLRNLDAMMAYPLEKYLRGIIEERQGIKVDFGRGEPVPASRVNTLVILRQLVENGFFKDKGISSITVVATTQIARGVNLQSNIEVTAIGFQPGALDRQTTIMENYLKRGSPYTAVELKSYIGGIQEIGEFKKETGIELIASPTASIPQLLLGLGVLQEGRRLRPELFRSSFVRSLTLHGWWGWSLDCVRTVGMGLYQEKPEKLLSDLFSDLEPDTHQSAWDREKAALESLRKAGVEVEAGRFSQQKLILPQWVEYLEAIDKAVQADDFLQKAGIQKIKIAAETREASVVSAKVVSLQVGTRDEKVLSAEQLVKDLRRVVSEPAPEPAPGPTASSAPAAVSPVAKAVGSSTTAGVPDTAGSTGTKKSASRGAVFSSQD